MIIKSHWRLPLTICINRKEFPVKVVNVIQITQRNGRLMLPNGPASIINQHISDICNFIVKGKHHFIYGNTEILKDNCESFLQGISMWPWIGQGVRMWACK